MARLSWPETKNAFHNQALRRDRSGIAALIGVCLLAAAGLAGATTIGGAAGGYLRSPVGADAYARGGAQTGDPTYLAAWWNPAKLPLLSERKVALGGGIRSLGRTDGLIGWEFRIPPRAALGLAVLYRGDPFLKGLRDSDEDLLEDGRYTTLTMKVGLGYILTRKLSVGIAIGTYHQRLPTSYELTTGELVYSSTTGIGGLDLAARFVPAEKWVLAVALRGLIAGVDWEIAGPEGFNAHVVESFLPTLTIAGQYRGMLAGKPLIWSCDVIAHLIDGEWSPLDHPEVVINNGLEWRRWDVFWVRAGLRDLAFNGGLVSEEGGYLRRNGFAFTTGFGLDLSKQVRGLVMNWAFSTDKVGAGLETQFDMVFSF